ncbi:MAG: AMP-binding protein [Rhodobacteraceae bacterium]|nr:AMP-binding protein [Paracoccaceae bacterium]
MSPHHPPWFDPALPPRDACVLPCLIDKWAKAKPDAHFIAFESGARWTWQEARTMAVRTASALKARGIGRGDTVLAWLPNSEAMVRAWFGANYLGAILVPINTSYRRRLLEHVVATSRAKLMIAHPKLVDRLADVARGELTSIIVDAPSVDAPVLDLKTEPISALDGEVVDTFEAPQLWDTQMVIFTSGTTGASKGVLAAYLHLWTTGQITYGYTRPDDCMLINLPMYHVGGTSSMMAAVSAGASVALYDGFSTQNFWSQIREHNATTISGLIGAMTTFLAKTEPHESDRDNPLRICTLAPINDQTTALSQRFDFDYLSGFNMTELSCPLITDVNERTASSCGRPRSGVQCRLVDDHDIEVPCGKIGELVVRSDRPWDLFSGYLGNPEATATAWRNGWFHSGDLMRQDERGNFFFVDRKKDAIRRRGENISSIEVEVDVAAYPAVREVAAYGVTNPDGEEDVMIAVAPRAGQSIDPAALIAFLTDRMAHFMVPRYVRVEQELPKTTTNKIQKTELRAQGIGPGTWDRDAAGIRVKRDKL